MPLEIIPSLLDIFYHTEDALENQNQGIHPTGLNSDVPAAAKPGSELDLNDLPESEPDTVFDAKVEFGPAAAEYQLNKDQDGFHHKAMIGLEYRSSSRKGCESTHPGKRGRGRLY